MNTNGQSEPVAVSLPSLPKGGGSIRGMGEAIGNAGMTGQSSLSIPLPISAGRGYVPNLSLAYDSGQGNGCFGIGWSLPLLTIRRRTSTGVPRYLGNDDYLSPDNEVMTPELDANNQVVFTRVTQYGGMSLDQTYTVTRYFPRVMGGFDRIEHWQGTGKGSDFWLIHSVDGQLHSLGKQPLSRIADPSDPGKIGQWLLDESCSPNGEHICYAYKSENTENVDMIGQESDRTQTSNRYLMQVQYGNASPYAPLYAWGNVPAEDTPIYLFTLVFDYGERTLDPLVAPPWTPQQQWLCRGDSFSDYALGFEVRTHRLCHQVLMFHHFPDELASNEYLVSRLLLSYDQGPQLTQLSTAQSFAYESNGTVQSVPPLELAYTPFNPNFSADDYRSLPAFPGWNDGTQYQIVDLYGEGLPGILYQAGSGWWYQAPQRASDGPDSIGYATWQPLPVAPSTNPEQTKLMDLTGDGRLDWIIAQPGLAGYFTLSPDRSWSHFIPLPVLPTEFLQPSAQLANLTGGGLADLGLIGPRSVRLYPNRRADGFSPPMEVPHDSDNDLPVFDGNPGSLVAFSDVLGSGQSHLVRVRYNTLECWPNLGWGKFGKRLTLTALHFDPDTFDPARVFLADIAGSGAADLIYAESDHFKIYLNHSGNGVDPIPRILPMPKGVTYDRLDQVSFVDLDGTGTTTLVLTIPHIASSHWCYSFSPTKPYLLKQINNNLGARTTLTYRSSAQEWLDEKQTNPASTCRLPFPVMLLNRVISLDEVNGNTLSQCFSYRQGIYAGTDREFRGFGFVQQLDTDTTAASTGKNIENTAPTLTKIWYHTGLEDAETNPASPPYSDPAMFKLGPTRFTRFNPATGDDDVLRTIDSTTRYQLFRALAGRELRVEVYGADDSPQNNVPYSVSTSQYQVRLVQSASPAHPYVVAVSSPLAELSVNYDRVEADPQVHQSVSLQVDAYCTPVWSVDIDYARRSLPPVNPYPPNVPEAQWLSTYDDSQQVLRLIETRRSVYNLVDPQVWRLGIPYEWRQNVITDPSGYADYPANAHGLESETLRSPDGVLGHDQVRVLVGQEVAYYFNREGNQVLPAGVPPPPLVLVHHVETAELDHDVLAVYVAIPDLDRALTDAGYCERPVVLSVADASPGTVWVKPHSYTTYVNGNGEWLPFALPRAQQTTPIVGPINLKYDVHHCVVVSVTDVDGLETITAYDYRFLTPWQITDPNLNVQQVLFDALGRVVATSFFGRQLAPDDATAVQVGFAPVGNFNAGAPALDSIDAALADPSGALQQAASTYLYAPFSWMGRISGEQLTAHFAPSEITMLWDTLQQHHLIIGTGHILAKGRHWARGEFEVPALPPSLRALVSGVPQIPVHNAALNAEQFPQTQETDRQIQILLAYSDGFGRSLQSKQKTEPGQAYVVDGSGQLVLDNAGQPLVKDTTPDWRWVVSGRVDYNNKGLPVRRYQPYFIDQPRYVNDASIQQWGYADTLYYDPL
uniref:SpvB/TcaC N-terminal domain-containing protein n=1 Tax=Burkholderia sp. GbtcB21 TaxID=2824766 RepID=UPI001C2F6054